MSSQSILVFVVGIAHLYSLVIDPKYAEAKNNIQTERMSQITFLYMLVLLQLFWDKCLCSSLTRGHSVVSLALCKANLIVELSAPLQFCRQKKLPQFCLITPLFIMDKSCVFVRTLIGRPSRFVLQFEFVMKVILTSCDHLCLKTFCSDSQACLRGDCCSDGDCSSSTVHFFWLKNEQLLFSHQFQLMCVYQSIRCLDEIDFLLGILQFTAAM